MADQVYTPFPFAINSLPDPQPIGMTGPRAHNPTFDEDTEEVLELAGEDPVLIKQEMETDPEVASTKARQALSSAIGSPTSDIDHWIESGTDSGAMARGIYSKLAKAEAASKVRPSADALYVAQDPNSTDRELNWASNRSMMERMMQQKLSESGYNSQGWISTGADFLDYHLLRNTLTLGYEDITNRTERLGLKLSDIADLPPDEAEKAMEEYIKGIEEEGILTGNNRFAYEQMLREFNSLGYNSSADSDFVLGAGFAALDVVTLGTSSTLRKLSRPAFSKFSKQANVQGPVAAGESIQRAIVQSENPTAIVEGGTDMLNPGRAVTISGPTNPVQSITPGTAANAPDATFSFRDRLSRWKVQEVDEAIKKIPPHILEDGISENNIDLVEDILRNPDWTIGQALYRHGGRVPATNLRERLSRMSVEQFREASTKVKGIDPEEGLSESNLRAIENYFGHNLPTNDELNQFFGGSRPRVTAGGVTVTGTPVTTFRGTAGVAANSLKAPTVANLPTAPKTMPPGTTVINHGRVPVAVPPPNTPVPPMPTANAALTPKTLLQSIDETIKKGFAGRVMDEQTLQAKVQDIAAGYAKRVSRPLFNSRVVDGLFHNKIASIEIGTESGAPFKSAHAAQTWMDNVVDKDIKARSIVAQVDPLNAEAGFVVHIEENVRQMADFLLDGSIRGSSPIDMSKDFGFIRYQYARLLGSSVSVDDLKNSTRAQMGESSATNFNAMATELTKVYNRADDTSKWVIDQIFRELRDGPHAGHKDYLTDSEFTREFIAKHPTNKAPSQKDIEAYHALLSLDETAWYLNADTLLQKVVNSGYEAIKLGGNEFLGRKTIAAKVGPNDKIKQYLPNGTTNLIFKGQLQPGDSVWALMEPEGTIQFVVNPEKVRAVRHSDVLGNNSGGRRTYRSKYFVVMEGADGQIAAKIAANTEAKAAKATEEINTILAAHKAGAANIDDIVRANRSFDSSIDSFSDFSKWATDNGVSLDAKFTYKAHGGKVTPSDAKGTNFIPVPDITWGERFAMRQSRSDTPLREYGGGVGATEDPFASIGKHFSQGANAIANQAAIRQGIDSWVRQVIEIGTEKTGWEIPRDVMNTGDFTSMFIQARQVGVTTEAGRRLATLRNVINARHTLAQSEGVEKQIAELTRQAGEWVLNSKFGNTTPIQYIGGKIVENDAPANMLLKMGFGAVFGFFNYSQFLMQAVHGFLTIPTISFSAAGTKALFMTPMVRAYLAAEGTKTGDLLASRVIKELGVDDTAFKQWIEILKSSGRSIVGNEVLELGTTASMGITKASAGGMPPSAINKALRKAGRSVEKVYDKSFMFYRAGEQYSRTASLTTAFFEYKAKFPMGNPLSDEGLEWITKRDHALSFQMTNAARATFQRGLGRFPTQWLAYPFRALEAVFLGRGLTAPERARAAFVLGPIWGTDNMGMDWATDYLQETFGLDPDDPTYTAIRDGLLDGLLDGVGLEISVGDRMSPIKGLLDLATNDLSEQNIYETLAGPSGTIVGGGVLAAWKTLGNFASGQPSFATEDFLRALRTVSAVDYMTKAAQIYQYGYMRSKTGYMYQADFDAIDAAIVAAGFSPQKVQEINAARTIVYKNDKELAAFRKEINSRAAVARDALNNGDREKFHSLFNDIELEIELSGLSFYQIQSIRKGLLQGEDSHITRMTLDLQKMGRSGRASALEQRTD